MPSRDLVVQNEKLRREVEFLKNELRFARNWRGLGVGSPPWHFFVIPEKNLGIPMIPEHAEKLQQYINERERSEYLRGRGEALLDHVRAQESLENRLLRRALRGDMEEFRDAD